MNHVGLVDHDRSFAILKRVRPSRLKKDGTTYIYRHVYICTYAYATRVSLLLLYPSVFQLLAPLLSCGYVCIIATNISHRPTFRSTTQHNHCRIIMVFLVFFFFFFSSLASDEVSTSFNITVSSFKSYNRIFIYILVIYIIYIIYIILKLTRYILLTRHT